MATRHTLTDHNKEIAIFQRRVLLGGLFVLFLSLLLITRLVYLQVYRHNLYTTLAQKNQLMLISVAPNRGLIYDRNGVLLAENIPAYSLEIIPDKVTSLAKTIKAIKQLIPISADDEEQFYKLKKQRRSFESIPLKLKLTPAEVAKFYVNQYRFPGVLIKAHLIRHYPLGKSMTSVLGYVGRINASELAKVNASNYSDTNYIGKVGVEKYFEKQLHGAVGYEQVETDASGRTLRVIQRIPPVPGNNITLTIDSGLQLAAEKALGDNRGSVVAIQPNTGQILALLSNPSYNPNNFVTGMTTAEYDLLQNSPDQPLYNRAIRGQYPLGSTIKPFLALQGLQTGTITPKTTIYDPGYFRIPGNNHKFRDWAIHGWVNVHKAIVVSCDTFFYTLAYHLGITDIDKIMTSFGFGKDTGVQMGEELPGLVASPAWKRKVKGEPWYTGDTVNASIGQGYMLATPLQLAQGTAILAERGLHFKPNLVLNMQAPDGNIITHQPIAEQPVSIDPRYWRLVIQSMVGVIKSKQGTGFRFGRHAPYSVAAKTGTAQLFTVGQNEQYIAENVPTRLRDNSVFIAFAPVDKPQIAIAVVVENKPIAPAVARKIMDDYFITQKHLKEPADETIKN